MGHIAFDRTTYVCCNYENNLDRNFVNDYTNIVAKLALDLFFCSLEETNPKNPIKGNILYKIILNFEIVILNRNE